MPTVYIETYGCQMNVADTELMLGHLGSHGYRRTDAPDAADVILLTPARSGITPRRASSGVSVSSHATSARGRT